MRLKPSYAVAYLLLLSLLPAEFAHSQTPMITRMQTVPAQAIITDAGSVDVRIEFVTPKKTFDSLSSDRNECDLHIEYSNGSADDLKFPRDFKPSMLDNEVAWAFTKRFVKPGTYQIRVARGGGFLFNTRCRADLHTTLLVRERKVPTVPTVPIPSLQSLDQTGTGVTLVPAKKRNAPVGGPKADARSLFREGFDLIKQDRLDEAIKQFENGLRLDPENAVAHFHLGNTFRSVGRYRDANLHYEETIRLTPQSQEAVQAKIRMSAVTPSRRSGTASGKDANVIVSPTGDRYEGDVFNARGGKGLWVGANGDRYEGNFANGIPNGSGTFKYKNGEQYQGQVSNGLPSGRGIYVWSNGDRYEGDLYQGKMSGRGELRLANGNRYSGDFRNSKMNGQGEYTLANGDRYVGGFADGVYSGSGSLHFSDGSKYDGDFVNGVFQGRGIYSSQGSRYEGEFVNGLFHGRGSLFLANGERRIGTFAYGKYVAR